MTDKPVQQTLLQGKPWVPAHLTNVQDTWRKFGWQPVAQLPPAVPVKDSADGRLHQDRAP